MAKPAKIKEDAQKYFASGKYDKALLAYSQLTKLEPHDPKNIHKVADLQLKLGQNKDAVDSYKKACEVYMKKGFLIQAIAMCKVVMQMDPSQKEIEKRLAELYSQRGVSGSPGAASSPRSAATRSPAPPPAQAPVAGVKQPAKPTEPIPKAVQPLKATPKQEPAPQVVDLSEEIEAEPEPAEKPTKQVEKKEPTGPKVWAISEDELESAGPEIAPDEELGVAQKASDLSDTIEPKASKPKSAAGKRSLSVQQTDLPPLETPLPSGGMDSLGDLPPLDIGMEPEGGELPPLEDKLSPMQEQPSETELAPELPLGDEGIEIDVMGDSAPTPPEPEIEGELEPEPQLEAEPELAAEEPLEAEPELIEEEPEKPSLSHEALDEEWEEQGEAPAPPSGQALLDEDVIEDIGLFPEIPLFKDLNKEQFQSVVQRLQTRSFNKGDTLIKEGEDGDSIYIISSGQVSIHKNSPGGKKVNLGQLREGDFFGEFGYFAGSRRQASVVATEETEVLEMSREDMDAVIAEHSQVEAILEQFYKERVMQNILATSALFRELSLEERRNVAQRFTLEEVKEGKDIVVEGTEGDAMYLIRSGVVSVHTKNPMGERVHLAELSAGDFFGEVSLVQGKPRTATVTANSPIVELMKLGKVDFDKIVENYPDVLEKLKQVIAKRLEQTVNKVSILDLDEEEAELGSLL